MDVCFLGHAAVLLKLAHESILIDPFLTGNPLASMAESELSPSHIILTHAHGDHVGDSETIAKRCGAKLISSFEIVNYMTAKGVEGHPMNPGGKAKFSFGSVKFTPAWHSSSFPDGSYGGMPMGVVIEAEGKTIYHAGDTALFGDMSLIARHNIDVALLPIGDNFTMGPEDALEAVKLLKPKQVIPIHYDTFDLIKQDPDLFKKQVEAHTTASCVALKPGEVLSL